ncbi:MAG: hypothetical protein KIT10_06605 [Flavobacteriales bacterium]|nr:hypothetical protein [Flavobacteriales bacterium]
MTAQLGVTTVGLQLKPVIPFQFFDPLTTVEAPSLRGSIELTGGLAYGMSIRVGLTNTVSLETGIAQITRRYQFSVANDTTGYLGSDRVRYVGYEVPVMGLVYIRLGERSWMNAALGFAMDMYPSDAQRDVEEGRIYIFRRNWAQTGIIGNMGVEYRTEKSGTFYLGATYHRPFNDMALADFTWYGTNFFPYNMRTVLDGSYLTADLRYYFHEDPDHMRRLRRNR